MSTSGDRNSRCRSSTGCPSVQASEEVLTKVTSKESSNAAN